MEYPGVANRASYFLSLLTTGLQGYARANIRNKFAGEPLPNALTDRVDDLMSTWFFTPSQVSYERQEAAQKLITIQVGQLCAFVLKRLAELVRLDYGGSPGEVCPAEVALLACVDELRMLLTCAGEGKVPITSLATKLQTTRWSNRIVTHAEPVVCGDVPLPSDSLCIAYAALAVGDDERHIKSCVDTVTRCLHMVDFIVFHRGMTFTARTKMLLLIDRRLLGLRFEVLAGRWRGLLPMWLVTRIEKFEENWNPVCPISKPVPKQICNL
jgi:hypothetical protein